MKIRNLVVPFLFVLMCCNTGCSNFAPPEELPSQISTSESEPDTGAKIKPEKGHSYISITYGRNNSDNFTGREVVYYTYDIETKELKEECVLPFDSDYACGVVCKANHTVYYSGRTEPENPAACDGLWAYDIETGEKRLLENENWSYNSITMMGDDTLLVMAITKDHVIQPALFNLNTGTFTYMSDANGEPRNRYSCGGTPLDYNITTHQIACIYQEEEEVYSSEYRGIQKPIDTYIAFASERLEKDVERIWSKDLLITDRVETVTQISENELWVVMTHDNPEAEDPNDFYTTKLYSLVFTEEAPELKPIRVPYPNSGNWETIDGGKTFYFLHFSDETLERGLYYYSTETDVLTEILPGNSQSKGHVVNFSIVDCGN